MKIKAVERELIEPGWKKAFQTEDIPADGKGKLSALEIGQRVCPKKVRATRQRGLTEARLIGILREKSIGRPATYALIVEALLGRKYVERELGGQLRLTQRGREVCDFLVGRLLDLFDLAYTARMESALDEVAKGQLSYGNAAQNVWASLQGIESD